MKVKQISEEQLARYNEMLVNQEVRRAKQAGIAIGFRGGSFFIMLNEYGFHQHCPYVFLGFGLVVLVLSSISIATNSREIESEI
jgi:alpha-acetolactate decarboxylase